MTTALVLAGHGSHISPQTAGLVWEQVDALRAMGAADEVTAAFWKEAPAFSQVFNTLTATDITVVPLFTAQGYFTQTVIPAEMGLAGPLTLRDGRTIRYARTLSEHPFLSQVVRQRVEDGLRAVGVTGDQAAIAIIGHSTRRNPESRRATEQQADLIRKAGLAREVVAVFLDDTPDIPSIYSFTTAPVIITVPYFLASGSHTTLDVPKQLGLPQGRRQDTVHGHTVYYTDPVGETDSLLVAIFELAREAGLPARPTRTGSAWDCFPAAGRDDLIAAVMAAGLVQIGQLQLTPTEVRCGSDPSHRFQRIATPAALRKTVREQGGTFRPLATATDLGTDPAMGWRVELDDPALLHAVVETVYPGVVADWSAARSGSFAVNSFERLVARQTGIFQTLVKLDNAARADLTARVCGRCVRHPAWFDGADNTLGVIPCAEPCNVWMSEALEQIKQIEM